jgi:hypothetical protein
MMQQFFVGLMVSIINGYAMLTCFRTKQHIVVKIVAFIVAVVSTFAFTSYIVSN